MIKSKSKAKREGGLGDQSDNWILNQDLPPDGPHKKKHRISRRGESAHPSHSIDPRFKIYFSNLKNKNKHKMVKKIKKIIKYIFRRITENKTSKTRAVSTSFQKKKNPNWKRFRSISRQVSDESHLSVLFNSLKHLS